MENIKLYSYRQAAELLQVSERTIWSLVNERKQLKAVKIGNRIRISQEAIQEFIRKAAI